MQEPALRFITEHKSPLPHDSSMEKGSLFEQLNGTSKSKRSLPETRDRQWRSCLHTQIADFLEVSGWSLLTAISYSFTFVLTWTWWWAQGRVVAIKGDEFSCLQVFRNCVAALWESYHLIRSPLNTRYFWFLGLQSYGIPHSYPHLPWVR